jgi:hypothetical protein
VGPERRIASNVKPIGMTSVLDREVIGHDGRFPDGIFIGPERFELNPEKPSI